MNQGVEWAAHICVLLHWASDEDRTAVPVARLAQTYDLPGPYLVKQVQSLTRAGITESVPGRSGGVRLARPAGRITLMDVVVAIEGSDDAFTCTEIRQRGINRDRPSRSFAKPCGIAQAMRSAELAWRRELANTSIKELADTTPRRAVTEARQHLTGRDEST